MLYERWRQIAREYRRETALWDVATGARWTFGQLTEATESGPPADGPWAFPRGVSADFIFTVLRAWRSSQVVCPCELGQPAPHLDPPAPPASVHLKATSGSTGASRVVAFTAEQLAADAENIVATMGLRPDWPNLGVISLAHSYGFSNLITPLLLHGIPLVLCDSPLPEAVRRAATAFSAITLPAVPALWRAWHEAKSIPPNVKRAISAGAPLPLVLEQGIFDSVGLKLHNFYGASECGGIAYDLTSTPRTDEGFVGTPLQNVTLSVSDEGCLRVRSRAVGQTYWPEPAESLMQGCYKTSDLAELKEGRVYLRGRASDQINIAGRKISPETIERALLAHPQVRDCLVFSAPGTDPSRAEMIVACVAAEPVIEGETLRQFLLAQLPAWQVPRDWWLVESLGPNQRGKISRAEWRERYLVRRK